MARNHANFSECNNSISIQILVLYVYTVREIENIYSSTEVPTLLQVNTCRATMYPTHKHANRNSGPVKLMRKVTSIKVPQNALDNCYKYEKFQMKKQTKEPLILCFTAASIHHCTHTTCEAFVEPQQKIGIYCSTYLVNIY